MRGERSNGTQVEALDSLRSRKKLIIFPIPQAWLGPIPLVPSTKREITGGGVKRVRSDRQIKVTDRLKQTLTEVMDRWTDQTRGQTYLKDK